MQNLQKVIVKNYKGSQSETATEFQRDAKKMAELGYYPTSQNYAQGQYGCGAFILALILCFIIIGFVIFIYMLIVKPSGTLSVTYELKIFEGLQNTFTSQVDKHCPMCAESVKSEAKICRFCGHQFEI